MQAKLLRVLQEQCFERLGGTEPIRTDARIIASSSRPLARLVREGRFREDLYYRLNVVRLELPPLRDRPADVAWLAAHFAARGAGPGRPPKTIAPEALDLLQAYAWPGNIRELENAVERACITAPGDRVRPGDFPPEVLRPVRAAPRFEVDLTRPLLERLAEAQAAVEQRYLRAALRKSGGNISRCAALCGLSRRSVARKVAEYRIDKATFRDRAKG
jgi:DNA-binding NtrC family response regulator